MILKNEFHGTQVELHLWGSRNFLTPYQVKRAWKALCGGKRCACGDNTAEYKQVAGIYPNLQCYRGEWFRLSKLPDGGAILVPSSP